MSTIKKFVRKEDVLKMFEELTPWDQSEVLTTLARKAHYGPDLESIIIEFSAEELLKWLDMDDILHYVGENADDYEIDDAFGDIIRDRYEEED